MQRSHRIADKASGVCHLVVGLWYYMWNGSKCPGHERVKIQTLTDSWAETSKEERIQIIARVYFKMYLFLTNPAGRQTGSDIINHLFLVQTDVSCSVDWSTETQSDSSLSIPAPDRSIVAHCDQDAAVAAEAGLPDGRRAFGKGQRGAPGEQRGDRFLSINQSIKRSIKRSRKLVFVLLLTFCFDWN